MNTPLQRLASVGLLVLTAACSAAPPPTSQPAPLTDAQRALVADSARAVVQRVIDASNKLDFTAGFTYFSADSDARYVENGVMYPSLDSLKAAYAGLVPLLEVIDNSVDRFDVAVLGHDVAAVTAPIHLRIKAKGRPETKGQYVFSCVVQNRNGKWVIVQTHESWQEAERIMAALMPATGGG